MLGLADGPAPLQHDLVPNLEPVVRVVGLVLLLDPNPPVVLGVLGEPDHHDVHGLVVGVANHEALHRFHVGDSEADRWGRRERGLAEERERRRRWEDMEGGF